jgi:hypothetical protein
MITSKQTRELLDIAGHLAGRRPAAAVTAIAARLEEWLDGAVGPDDAGNRMCALRQARFRFDAGRDLDTPETRLLTAVLAIFAEVDVDELLAAELAALLGYRPKHLVAELTAAGVSSPLCHQARTRFGRPLRVYPQRDVTTAWQRLTDGSSNVVSPDAVAEAFLAQATVLYAHLTR